MSQLKKKSTREILTENLSRKSPLATSFTLFAHNIRSQHNVGSLFRSCDSFGVHQLILSGYTPTPPSSAISKTALGAEQYVSWKQVKDPVDELNRLKRNEYLICALEQTNQSTMLQELDLDSSKICLLLGNEVTGIDESLLPLTDQFAEIPQFGNKHSLNVSVAAGIALYAFFEKLG